MPQQALDPTLSSNLCGAVGIPRIHTRISGALGTRSALAKIILVHGHKQGSCSCEVAKIDALRTHQIADDFFFMKF